jgi:predicted lipase
MDLLNLYKKCLSANYTTVENQGDYAVKQIGTKLYIFFEDSDGKVDWKNNFNFPAKPYKDMGKLWFCHRGFLKVWKSIEPHIKDAIMKQTVKSVTIVGYSHGAAIATLCHEYVWFNRPDLRDKLEGYGFGAPRVFWGWFMSKELKERWANFHIIRNLNDIVTHMPPRLFGFRHVNNVMKIGEKGKFAFRKNKLKCVDAHRQQNYIYSLQEKCNE